MDTHSRIILIQCLSPFSGLRWLRCHLPLRSRRRGRRRLCRQRPSWRRCKGILGGLERRSRRGCTIDWVPRCLLAQGGCKHGHLVRRVHRAKALAFQKKHRLNSMDGEEGMACSVNAAEQFALRTFPDKSPAGVRSGGGWVGERLAGGGGLGVFNDPNADAALDTAFPTSAVDTDPFPLSFAASSGRDWKYLYSDQRMADAPRVPIYSSMREKNASFSW